MLYSISCIYHVVQLFIPRGSRASLRFRLTVFFVTGREAVIDPDQTIGVPRATVYIAKESPGLSFHFLTL